MMLLLFIFLY